jgi:DNA-binding transcriptional MerR regulator
VKAGTHPTPIGSYTSAEVARLAGVSPRRVGRWAREGIILPSVSTRPNRYSYADAGEAILAHYLMEQGKPPRDIRSIVHTLRDGYGDWPLASAPLAHDGQLLLVRDS